MKQNVLKYLLYGVFIGALSIVFITCKDNDDDIKALRNSQQDQEVILDELISVLEDTESSLTILKNSLGGQVSTAVDAKIKDLLTDVSVLKLQVENHQKVIGDANSIVDKYLTIAGGLTTLAEQIDKFENKLGEVTYDELATLAGLNDEVKRQEFATLAELLVAYQARISELELQTAVLEGYEGVGSIKGAIDGLDENLQKIKSALFDDLGDKNLESYLESYLDTYDYVTKKDLADLIGEDVLILKLKSLITGIALVKNSTPYVEIPIYTSVPTDYTFGEGIDKAITFKSGGKQTTGPQSFIVQVTPANVDLQEDYELSFVNSDGDQVKLDIIKIAKYTKLLTRGDAQTGLFEITVEWNAAAAAANFGESTKEVRYAFAVDKKIIADGRTEDRHVLTGYDILFINGDGIYNDKTTNVNDVLNFDVTVGVTPTHVKDIKNRFDKYTDLRWTIDSNHMVDFGGVTEADIDDMRDAITTDLNVELGQSVTVELTGKAATNALAYYVALDKESTSTTDLALTALWGKLVTGDINKVIRVTESKSARLFIANDKTSYEALSDNKEVGLRVFVVNADGTLVDPDGRSFYITLKNENDPIEFTTTIDDVILTPTTGVAFAPIAVTGASFITNLGEELRKTITSVTLDVNLDFVDETGAPISGPLNISPLKKDGTLITKWEDTSLAKISIDGYVIPSSFGASTVSSVTGTITVLGQDGEVIGKYTVTLQRTVTLKPVDFGNLDSEYLFYVSPTSDGKGTVSLEELFEGSKIATDRLQVIIAGDKTPISTEIGSSELILDKDQIKTVLDGKSHAATVNYNYGYIYSEPKEHSTVLGNTTFSFLTELQTMTWEIYATKENWTPRQGVLAYGTTNTISLDAFTSYFKGVDYILVDAKGKPEILDPAIKSYTLVGASVITTSSGSKKTDAYYTIKVAPEGSEGKLIFTPTSIALNTRDTHVLQLKIQDIFDGVTYTAELSVRIQ
ncbi:hypothetical protein EZS27_010668 [termite gut metagenome]|uniref:Uncharacterized protein n=1 Tax=termite gut metagenome TaxID=433724 RepID=A0A5J4S735_9ZZZZ